TPDSIEVFITTFPFGEAKGIDAWWPAYMAIQQHKARLDKEQKDRDELELARLRQERRDREFAEEAKQAGCSVEELLARKAREAEQRRERDHLNLLDAVRAALIQSGADCTDYTAYEPGAMFILTRQKTLKAIMPQDADDLLKCKANLLAA